MELRVFFNKPSLSPVAPMVSITHVICTDRIVVILTKFSSLHWRLAFWQLPVQPGEGTPSMLGDMDVPPFWSPFLTFWGLNTIFLGYFFSSINSKAIFWGTKTTNFCKNRSFWPQIQFFPRSFWVQFSAATGTPPSVFRPSTPPPPPPPGRCSQQYKFQQNNISFSV